MNPGEYATMYQVETDHWWYRSLRGMLVDFTAAFPEDARVLDVGCGTGANMQALNLACGIDFSHEAVRFCREREMTGTATASAIALPFADASFDAAISCDVLCHHSIANKSEMLQEISRVLRPGALMVLNLPAYSWLMSSHDAHVGTDRRFRMNEMPSLLTSAGFEPVRVTYWNTLMFPVAAAVRLWRQFRPPPASDLAAGSGEVANGVLRAVLRMERSLIRLAPMPFGLSLLVLAKKR
jgi:SAM-dependent methyltransferase